MNKAQIIGNLCNDPEVRAMQNGDSVVNVTVASNETWKDKQTGERKSKAEFHRVVIFNQGLAKLIQYAIKGSKVYIEGQLQTRKWTDSNGVDKYTTEIVVKPYKGEIELLDSKKDNQDMSAHGGFTQDDMDDHIPF